MKRIAPQDDDTGEADRAFGRFGYAARAVVLAVSGVFFIVAAVQYDPNKSKGISGSLQELAQHSWGRVLLWATAIGLFLFGLFCLPNRDTASTPDPSVSLHPEVVPRGGGPQEALDPVAHPTRTVADHRHPRTVMQRGGY